MFKFERLYLSLVKGYRDEECKSVEKRCSVHYPLPKEGENFVVLFEDYVFQVVNLGDGIFEVEVKELNSPHKLGKFLLDDENGISGWFSSSSYYREVFCVLIEDYPGQFDD